jgi:hypothetical protein
MSAATITIARRFRGPPRSANGGYACGVLAREIPGAATVRLLAPPPLETPLALATEADALRLYDGDRPVAQARAATLAVDAPEAPPLAVARDAATRFKGFASHPFPGCFVCGPERPEGDGLRIFPGAVAGHALVAAPWTPDPNLADAGGRVATEFLWSALDCTGFFAFAPLPDGTPALLGELTARIDRDAEAGAPHVVVGWRLGEEGRKRFVGSALYTERGELVGLARGTWIVVAQGAAGAV